MKILYSVQATGNGHISRAMELLPYLQKHGTVDIFLSGANSTLELNAPIKYRSKGLSLFYTCTGDLDYASFLKKFAPLRMKQEARDLPVEKYDLVLNDFESITALACSQKKVKSIQFGHQASFMSDNTPRPVKKSTVGEWILKNYAKASDYMGLHFSEYDDFIYSPVIKSEIRNAEVTNKGHITVYLPAYCEPLIRQRLQKIQHYQFEVFSFQTSSIRTEGNIKFIPVDKQLFNESLISCEGIITGGGFETPAEAIYLGKKLMSIPINGQYEQLCNSAALKEMGIEVLPEMDKYFEFKFHRWLSQPAIQTSYQYNTEQIVDILMEKYTVGSEVIFE